MQTEPHVKTASIAAFGPREARVYAAHAMASVGSNLLIPAFFFYATRIFHWGSGLSLALVAAEGAVYVIGALLADRLAGRMGRKRALVLVQFLAAAPAAVAWIFPTPAIVVTMLLFYTMVSASAWPMLESLIAAGAGAELLSRRIGVYNLVWSGVGTVTLAVSGTIINRAPWGMFFIPMAAHAIALLLIAGGQVEPPESAAVGHAAPEAGLLRQRRLALWLSRLGLPATYTVLYSLVALMPSLRVIQSFSPDNQTVIASIWMGSRFLAFWALGASVWWHVRPRLLFAAAVVMLLAFLGVTLRPADWMGMPGAAVTQWDRTLMIAWQIPLGAAMGLIYSGSLYFGMVLSEGSTEHGGYHEALIGVGQVIGPAAALGAQQLGPSDGRAAVAAVAGILVVCLAAEVGVMMKRNGEG